MGSINPVFVLPAAAADGQTWATALAAAVTGSAGQLCTKPGLVVVPDTAAGEAFADQVMAAVAASPAFDRMLTPAMAQAHAAWLSVASRTGEVSAGSGPVRPFAVRVAAEELLGSLVIEHFGPAVVLSASPVASYGDMARRLQGSLTATILAGDGDDAAARDLLPDLVQRAGRIILNGMPTGVAVCDAMHHGGPWPAASDASFTSVGTGAIRRFLRPVALQGLPEHLLATVVPS
jgi:NADP-dependent aldehyde dehydrogenase